MFFGGWLYPEGASAGIADTGAEFNAIGFSADKFDCAATGTAVAQATSAPITRQFKAFRTGISFLSFNPLQKPTVNNTPCRWSNRLRGVIGQELQSGKALRVMPSAL
jgi:hypothetical protein